MLKFRHLTGPLCDADSGAAGGGGAGAGTSSGDGVLTPEMKKLINDEINSGISGYLKREFPKMLGSALKEQMPQMQESFLEALAEELPTDEELARMEADGELGGEGGEGGEGGGEGLPEDMSPELRASWRKMERQNADLQKKIEDLQGHNEQTLMQAEYSDRSAQVEGLLADYNWANPESRAMVSNYMLNNAWRDDDGNLVAGDEHSPVPLRDHMEERIKTMPNFLAPQQGVGGAGAVPGGKLPGAPTLDQIKPGMSKDEQASIMSHAVKALGGTPGASG